MGNDAITKQDLLDMEERLRAHFEGREERLRGHMLEREERLRGHIEERLDHLRNDLVEKIRDAQTEVLRAFYDWSRPIEGRVRRADELGQRMSWLEDRISELERGKRLGGN